MTTKILMAVAAVGLLVTGCANSSTRQAEGSKTPTERVIRAPDFSVETFEGSVFRLAEQRGTPVVLNFWESW